MSALGIQVFIDALGQSNEAGGSPVTGDDLVPILDNIAGGFTIVRDVFDHADAKANEAVTAATDAATQIAAVGQDVNDITGHTYRVVIPHSLSWLAGYVVTTWIDPIRKDIDTVKSSVSFLMGWRGQIDTWRKDHVDPTLTKYLAFKTYFDGWPTTALTTLHGWLTKPAEFAQWAAPPLIGPIVSYIASPAHKQSRDVLTLALVDAWSERPIDTWEAILRWVITD